MDWNTVLHNLWTDHAIPFLVQYLVPAAGTVVAALLIMLLNTAVVWAKARVSLFECGILRDAIMRLVEAAEKKFTEPRAGKNKYAWVVKKAEELYGIKLDEHEIEAAVYALGKQKQS